MAAASTKPLPSSSSAVGQLHARQEADVGELHLAGRRAVDLRLPRRLARRRRADTCPGRPAAAAGRPWTDAQHDAHVARPAAGRAARRRRRVALQVEAQRVGQTIVGEDPGGGLQRLAAGSGRPTARASAGTSARDRTGSGPPPSDPCRTGSASVARFPTGQRAVEDRPAQGRREACQPGHARPAPHAKRDLRRIGDLGRRYLDPSATGSPSGRTGLSWSVQPWAS